MRRIKLFSLIQERVVRRMCPSRWSVRHRASWTASGGSAAVESLETRCLLSAGDLDLSFGHGGRVTTSVGTGNGGSLTAVGTIQSDGKVVVAGSANDNGNSDFALARYNNDGSLDSSFDGDGTLTTDLGTMNDYVNSVAIQPDGKIVVAGIVYDSGADPLHQFFALARYNSDGSLDQTFDGDGKLTTNFGSSAVSTSMVLQPDGKIVVAGRTQNISGSNSDFALARYNANGSLDTSFDGDGLLTTSGGIGTGFDQANSLALQTDGKIVVAGETSRGGNNFALVRYNSDGSLDNSFDGDGMLTTSFGSSNSVAKSVVVRTDGKIVVVGLGGNEVLVLARYNSDGSLDGSFDGDGKLTTNFGPFADCPNW